MTSVWVVVENVGGLTEVVKAYQKEEMAVTEAKNGLHDHFKSCHNSRYTVEDNWDEEFNSGTCPCDEFLVGVYECPVHMEYSL